MSLPELLVLAAGVSMDAFAVSISLGMGMKKASFKKGLLVGLYFGIFQAAIPLAGYLVAALFPGWFEPIAPWIASLLLACLGIKMIVGAFGRSSQEVREPSLNVAKMIPFAVATSIDGLATGAVLAFLNIDIIPAVILMGIMSFVLAALGVKLGNAFGSKLKSKAEIFGGIMVLIIGIIILLGHLDLLLLFGAGT